jgi:SPP1 gp7 family putative phage head morphogenesis protein
MPSVAFKLSPVPFTEAIALARTRKVVLPAQFYDDVQEAAVQNAFTVGSLTSLSQIAAVRDALALVLADGKTFADFKQMVADNDIKLKVPSTIYRNAVQSSTMIGRWQHIVEFQEAFPYLIYDAIDDARTRPTHAAMDGFIAPSTDNVWGVWFPPNGHNCRCTINALSAEQARDRGYNGAPPPPGSPDVGWGFNAGTLYRQNLLSQLETDHVWKLPSTLSELNKKLEAELRKLMQKNFGRGAVLAAEAVVRAGAAELTAASTLLWMYLNDEKAFGKLNTFMKGEGGGGSDLALIYYGLRDGVVALDRAIANTDRPLLRYYPVGAVRSILDTHKAGQVVEYSSIVTAVQGDVPGAVGVVFSVVGTVSARRVPFNPTDAVQTLVYPPRARFLIKTVEQRGDVWYITAEETGQLPDVIL